MRPSVTPQDRELLQEITRDAKDGRLVMRAHALLDLGAGDAPAIVAKRYNVARSTVYNWLKRYATRGVSDEALRDRPRPGRPPVKHESDPGDVTFQRRVLKGH
jgi:transposase-like protein